MRTASSRWIDVLYALWGLAGGWFRADAYGCRTDFCAHVRPGPDPVDAAGRARTSKA